MQMHPRLTNTEISDPYVNQPDEPESFMVWQVGDIAMYIESEADWDALITAACLGKEKWQTWRQRLAEADEYRALDAQLVPPAPYELPASRLVAVDGAQ